MNKRFLFGLAGLLLLTSLLSACGGGDKPQLMYFRSGT